MLSDRRRRIYYLLLGGVFAVQLFLLFILAIGSIRFLSAIRAYVAGEGLWSKAQKDAVAYLRQYGLTGDPAQFERYRKAIAVPLADHEARLELEKDSPDLNRAGEFFIRGGNHPDDVLAMARLVRWFSEEQYLAEAIRIWREADGDLAKLKSLAQALRDAANVGEHRQVDAILREIDVVYERLTPLEDAFSRALGTGSRKAGRAVILVLVGGSVLLLAFGFIVSRVLLNRLRASEEQYRLFLDAAGDAIVLNDPQGGAIFEVNETACALTGISRDTLRSRRMDDLWLLASNGDKHLAGNDKIVDVRSTLARVAETEVMVSIVRDITEQRAFQQRSEEAARMEVVGRVAARVAHDFRTQLTGVMMYASEMRGQVSEPEFIHGFDQILCASQHGAALIQTLMSFSREERTRSEEFDLNELVREALEMRHIFLDVNTTLAVHCCSEPLRVKGERVRLKLAFFNLMSNARDAMPNGGTLTMTTWVESEHAVLVVKDTGIGMDETTRRRAFDQFFTTKSKEKGTGIGLWSVDMAVRQSHGSVWIESEPGKGTQVSIKLPLNSYSRTC